MGRFLKLLENPDITHYTLMAFRASGVHPHQKTTPFIMLLALMNGTIMSGIVVLGSVGFIVSLGEDDIVWAVDCLQSVFIYINITLKLFVLFWNKEILADILSQRSRFLSTEGFAPEVQEWYQNWLKKATRRVNIFMLMPFCVEFSFYIQPFLTGDLPLAMYIPEGWYNWLQLAMGLLAPCLLASMYGADALFWALSSEIILQFRLLSHFIKQWKIQEATKFKKDLKMLVDHQNFLFDYCNSLNNYNKGIFLNQFLLSVGIICLQLFVVSQKGFKLPNKIKCTGYSLMEVLEIGIFCFNAELISDASEEVGDAAYNSEWYGSDDPNVKHGINLIIARAQKRIVFSGFGLVWINLKTFTQIFKTALSFYSYINQLVLD